MLGVQSKNKEVGVKCSFEITDDMPIDVVIDALHDLIANCHFTDWKQLTAHPESDEAQGWGSSSIISVHREGSRYGKIGEFYDSCNLFLAVNAVRALPVLLQYISTLQIRLIEAERGGSNAEAK